MTPETKLFLIASGVALVTYVLWPLVCWFSLRWIGPKSWHTKNWLGEDKAGQALFIAIIAGDAVWIVASVFFATWWVGPISIG